MKKPATDPPIRKSVTMPASLWLDIAELQQKERCTTEAEAVRRIVIAGIRAIKKDRYS